MDKANHGQTAYKPSVLATDLDGTLIPLPGDQQNQSDLQLLSQQLTQHQVGLVFITGRHFASAMDALQQESLPAPNWIISDVGTSIFRRDDAGQFAAVEAYQQHLQQIVADLPVSDLKQLLAGVDGLRIQETEKQGRFKLSYYAEAATLEATADAVRQKLNAAAAPYSIVQSVDPFNGDGLIDLLPAGVSKAHALSWWVNDQNLTSGDVVFAGDSGNDLAAMTAGYQAIVVANASRAIARQAYDVHRSSKWRNRLYLAKNTATSGVLEGCRWFDLIDPPAIPEHRLGATPLTATSTYFSVWAPYHKQLAVEYTNGETSVREPLQPAAAGQDEEYFSGVVKNIAAGQQYRYWLGHDVSRPDPASSFQPAGVHGPSEVVDQHAFAWTDQNYRGVEKRDLIIYELHIGSFTSEGTFVAAIERLPELVDLGVTAIELLPVAQSPGGWNWGYDGVNFFAPRNTFGQPDDFKLLVDACHAAGLAVILDVVYNHSGPEGNYLAGFGPYFSSKRHSPWGDTFNFDGDGSAAVRRYVTENATYWLEHYHLDGLRLDAVHFMHDDSETTIHDQIRQATAEFQTAAGRPIHLIAESNVYDRNFLEQRGGTPPYDAIWCDDLMHAIYSQALPDLQLTYRKYQGAADVTEALQRGFLFEIQDNPLEPVRCTQTTQATGGHQHTASFITGLQTHDSVGNHPHGKRLHHLTSKDYQKAAAALAYLYPGIPMLFMGEEVATPAAFPFFVDFEDPALQKAVEIGREKEYPQYVWGSMMTPTGPEPFQLSKCHDRSTHDDDMYRWYRNLFALRKRGIAAGWLTAVNMTVSHDPQHSIFELQYNTPAGECIRIQSRLANDQQPATATIPATGELLLSSQPGATSNNGFMQLQRHHATVHRIDKQP